MPISDNSVTMYTSRFCPFCYRAKALLDSKNIPTKEIVVDGDNHARQEMMGLSGRHTVPQIWIGEKHVGGCDDLYALERSKQLDVLLEPYKSA